MDADDRFALSPRCNDPQTDWFGLEANPSGTINTTLTQGRRSTTMSNNSLTITGQLTADVELRYTPSGSAVANFTIASTPRSYDQKTNEWKDGETVFLRSTLWREQAENVAESLTKGARVIVEGQLKSRSYETKEGEKRTVLELEIEEIGASLRYATAKITRNQGRGNNRAGSQNAAPTQGNQEQPPAAGPQQDPGSFWGN